MVLDVMTSQVNALEVFCRRGACSSAPAVTATGHDFGTLSSLAEEPARTTLEKRFAVAAVTASVNELLARGAVK